MSRTPAPVIGNRSDPAARKLSSDVRRASLEQSARPGRGTIIRRRNPIVRLWAVWEYRELLGNLVKKELKVKYKNSILGFAWSLLNPLLYLVVFYLVFQIILQSGIPHFQIFLLSGVLCWSLFANAVNAGTASIVANASLVTKIWFPREILPLAATGAAFAHFLFQSVVLIGALIIFRWVPAFEFLPLLIPALAVVVVLGSFLGILMSAFNVRLRDTQHLLELAMLAWFWLTPIVYPYQQLATRLKGASGVLLLNPMTDVVIVFQRALYNKISSDSTPILPDASAWWYLRNVLVALLISIVLLLVAVSVFARKEGSFAEDV